MIACFAAGSLILFAILARYLHSRITLSSWTVRYGRSRTTATGGTASGTGTGTGAGARRPPRGTIYDKWLVLRFTVAFVALRCVALHSATTAVAPTVFFLSPGPC